MCESRGVSLDFQKGREVGMDLRVAKKKLPVSNPAARTKGGVVRASNMHTYKKRATR